MMLDNLDKLICSFRPKHLIYIAVDGAAPLAKLSQQRKRRIAMARKRVRELLGRKATAVKKAAEDFPEDEESVDEPAGFDFNIEPSDLPQDSKFSTAWITPGTKFMKDLSTSIKKHICNKINSTNQRDRFWKKAQIIYSGHEAPGEGEHKIMDMMRSLKPLEASKLMTHCILGSDADLELLSLALGMPNILVAQNTDGSFMRYDGAFIDSLGECINRDLAPKKDKHRILSDFMVMLALCGNDFLPAVAGFSLEFGGMDSLLQTYAIYLENGGSFLTEDACIKLECFQSLLRLYPAPLDAKMLKATIATINRLRENGGSIALKNQMYFQRGLFQQAQTASKVSIMPRFTRGSKRKALLCPQELAEELQIHISSPKCDGTFSFNLKRFKPAPNNGTRQFSEEYFRGLQWVLKYYMEGVPSWSWFYAFSNAPSTKDLLSIKEDGLKFNLGTPLPPYETLLAILPPTFACLLPPSLQPLMMANESPLKRFYSLNATAVLDLELFHTTLKDPSLPYAEFLSNSKDNVWSSAAILVKDPTPSFISPAALDTSVYTYPVGFTPLASRFRNMSCVPSFSLTHICHNQNKNARQVTYLANPFAFLEVQDLASILFQRETILISWPDVQVGKLLRLSTKTHRFSYENNAVVVAKHTSEEIKKWECDRRDSLKPYLADECFVAQVAVLVHFFPEKPLTCRKCSLEVERVAPIQSLVSTPSPQEYGAPSTSAERVTTSCRCKRWILPKGYIKPPHQGTPKSKHPKN
ncbi:5'-3' exoribonuclease 1 [Entomophthora muscae]|uniref:5'-3' exoribonuclease 1 n=1 Tax=Entomophthora muscae TaxID=34485 RepID=A0ACC2U6U6_9FUNG|nr:5'-3' exoribonuclease 1 [Entomophthora muscae]